MTYMENKSGFEMLVNGIISQAAKDYRSASRAQIRDPRDFEAKNRIKDVEKFFLSEWFQALTTVDGEYLLRRLKEETSEYKIKIIRGNRRRKRRKTA